MAYICIRCRSRFPVNTGYCTYCMEGGTIMLEPVRPRSSVGTGFQATSARDLVKAEWTRVDHVCYEDLEIGVGGIVLVYGDPGAGKSTFVTKLLDGIKGPVVYLAAEEKIGPQVGERLNRLGVRRRDFSVVGQGALDDLVDHCRQMEAVALAVDSIQPTDLQPADLRPLVKATGIKTLICTMQVTKAGIAAGSNAYLHEGDCTVHVADGRWDLLKSRYQELRSGPL